MIVNKSPLKQKIVKGDGMKPVILGYLRHSHVSRGQDAIDWAIKFRNLKHKDKFTFHLFVIDQHRPFQFFRQLLTLKNEGILRQGEIEMLHREYLEASDELGTARE